MAGLSEAYLMSCIPKIIPPLTGDSYKGDMGRIAVVGGCKEYAGAPYFAAISALKTGADLSHVFTTAQASTVIKTYSPELIVHQSLYESDTGEINDRLAEAANEEVSKWFNRLDVIVIGPGLGQDPLNCRCAKLVLQSARDKDIPLILDADSLYLVTKGKIFQPKIPGTKSHLDRDLVQGYSNAILTPNVNELRRLAKMLEIPVEDLSPDRNEEREIVAKEVARKLDGPVILSKGSYDVIASREESVQCKEPSSFRRCGGQGDILSGAAAVFVSWAKKAARAIEVSPLLLAAFSACVLTRRASRITFDIRKRSMVASDIITNLSTTLERL